MRLGHFLADRQLPPEHDPGAAGLGGSEGPAAWLKAAEHFGRCPLPVWITIQCIDASSRSQPRTARRRPTPATGPGTRIYGTSRGATPTPGKIVSGFSSPSPLNRGSVYEREAVFMKYEREARDSKRECRTYGCHIICIYIHIYIHIYIYIYIEHCPIEHCL
jgi:hypothetical protein